MEQRIADRNKIGSFNNMQQVLQNWQHLDEGCVTASRRNYIELMLRLQKHVWEHNVALVWLLKTLKIESYLEVGVLTCGSMVHALACNTVKRIVGIDGFNSTYAGIEYIKNKETLNIVKKQVAKFPGKSVELFKGISQEVLPNVGESFDLALVDGDHSEGGARDDLELVLPKVRKAIVFDDIHHPSHIYLEDVAVEFAAKHGLEMTVNHQPPGTVIFWLK